MTTCLNNLEELKNGMKESFKKYQLLGFVISILWFDICIKDNVSIRVWKGRKFTKQDIGIGRVWAERAEMADHWKLCGMAFLIITMKWRHVIML